MADSSEFLERFEERVGASGWRTLPSPSALVDQWRNFVETCAEGYASTIYEYENERSVRDLLETLIHDSTLRRYPELESLRDAVNEIDRRFRAECREDAAIGRADAPWWQRCVPRSVQGEFAEDLKSMFGITTATDG
jgi:hypothetical protein